MVSKEEFYHIKVEVFKNIITSYSLKCRKASTKQMLEDVLKGESSNVNIDRDLKLCEKFAQGKEMVLYSDVEDFCLQIQKEFSFRGLSNEESENMKKEITVAAEDFNKLYENKIDLETIYSKYGIKRYDALRDKFAELLKNR